MGTLRMRDLIEATGVTHRIVRQYIQRGVLPHATGRGTGPVYTEDHLVRLRAIRRLLVEHRSLDAIRQHLARLSPQQLAQLGAPPASATSTAAPPTPTEPPRPAGAPPYPAEQWARIALLPGLELHVRGDAGPLIRRMAEEIHARYSVPTD